MDDAPTAQPPADGASAPAAAPRPGPRPRQEADIRARTLRHRRRRATALGAIAFVALALGLTAGAVIRPGRRHGVPVAAVRRGYLSPIRSPAAKRARSLSADQAEDENAAITRTLSYTPYVRMAGTQHRELALTFDDGPGPYTPRILSILERTRTPATFFEVGAEDRWFAASTAKIVARGDPIGDHTETHAPMSRLSRADQQTQLLQQTSQTGNSGAPFPRMFRPPYGLWNDTTLALLRKYKMLMVLWSVDTDDWQRPGAGKIVSAALKGAKPGAIILMHDAGGDRAETIKALPKIIRTLRRRGYKLVTVPRLLFDNPAPRQQHVASLRGQGG